MVVFGISTSGIHAAIRRQDVTANNLANVVTPGFKTSRVDQVDLSTGGTRVSDVQVLYSQGPLELEGPGGFFLGVQGEGFFRVQTPNGERFTRAGSFHVDSQGSLVTPEGYRVQPNITVPNNALSVSVGSNGVVTAALPGGTTQQLGTLQLTRFPNPNGLLQEGGNLLAPSAAAGAAITANPGTNGLGTMFFGALEQSNVDLTTEMVSQIVNRTLLSANVKALRTQDRMLGDLLDIVR